MRGLLGLGRGGRQLDVRLVDRCLELLAACFNFARFFASIAAAESSTRLTRLARSSKATDNFCMYFSFWCVAESFPSTRGFIGCVR